MKGSSETYLLEKHVTLAIIQQSSKSILIVDYIHTWSLYYTCVWMKMIQIEVGYKFSILEEDLITCNVIRSYHQKPCTFF